MEIHSNGRVWWSSFAVTFDGMYTTGPNCG